MAGFEEEQIFKAMANLESTASFLEEPTRDAYIDEAGKKTTPTLRFGKIDYDYWKSCYRALLPSETWIQETYEPINYILKSSYCDLFPSATWIQKTYEPINYFWEGLLIREPERSLQKMTSPPLYVYGKTEDSDAYTKAKVNYSFGKWAREEHIDEAGKERIHIVGCDVDNARSNLMFWGIVVSKQGESYFKELADKQEKMPNFKSYGGAIGSSLLSLKAADCGEMFSPDKRKKTLDYTKVALDSSGKMTSQLFDLNMYDGETLSMRKRKNIVQRLSSFLIAAIVLYWIISDTCSQLSVFQLQLGRGWSSLLQLLGFTVFVCAVTAMIAVGAPFSRLQRTMLMFWAILMLIRSAMSRTALYVSILGILLTGWHGLVEKTATT